LEVDVTDV